LGNRDRLIQQILSGRSDANVRFDELCGLLKSLGFVLRTSGSHHVFRMEGVEEKINLQRDGDKAKVYQVRQVRQFFVKYRIGE